MKVEIRTVDHDTTEYWQSWNLRETILRHPLGLKFTDEDQQAEKHQFHLAAIRSSERGVDLVGAAVLAPNPNGTIKMQRVAISSECQRLGIGSRLVAFAEDFSAARGYELIFCHARQSAIPFYRRHGYVTEGDMFIEQTIPHQKMRKTLRNPSERP